MIKKFAPWILIPAVCGLLQWMYTVAEAGVDLSEPTFGTTDDAEIRFRNVRQLAYSWEDREDAGMRLYRYKRRPQQYNHPDVEALLLLSPITDRAYIRAEVVGDTLLPDTAYVHWQLADSSGTLVLTTLNAVGQYRLATQLYEALQAKATLSLEVPGRGTWPLFDHPRGQSAYETTMEDFYRLVGLR